MKEGDSMSFLLCVGVWARWYNVGTQCPDLKHMACCQYTPLFLIPFHSPHQGIS